MTGITAATGQMLFFPWLRSASTGGYGLCPCSTEIGLGIELAMEVEGDRVALRVDPDPDHGDDHGGSHAKKSNGQGLPERSSQAFGARQRGSALAIPGGH